MPTIVYFNGGERLGPTVEPGQPWDAKYILEEVKLGYGKTIGGWETAQFQYTADMKSRDVQMFCETDDQDRVNPLKYDAENTLGLSYIRDDGSLSPPSGAVVAFGPTAQYTGVAFDTVHVGRQCTVKLNRTKTFGSKLVLGTVEYPPE